MKLPAMDEATLSYRFKHSDGYVYGLGGKLPGMCAMGTLLPPLPPCTAMLILW